MSICSLIQCKMSLKVRVMLGALKKALQQNAKGLEMSWLPGLVSESVLIWDNIKISIERIKHGKFRIVCNFQ